MATSEDTLISNAKKRGRPYGNGRVHELYSAELKRLISTDQLSSKDRKLIKSVAQTMLYQGYSITEISDALSIPKSTACLWRDKLDDKTRAEIEQNVLNSISTRMAEFLNASLESIARVARYCSEETYIAQHSPAQVARLIEVLGDQAFRLIEAKQRADFMKRQREIEDASPVGQTIGKGT